MIFQIIGIDLIGVFIALLLVFIAYFKWSFQYWKRKNVPFLKPRIPYGNFESPLRRTIHPGLKMKEVYDKAKSKGWKHCGIYVMSAPNYLVIDLDYVKNILTKDFQYFTDRGIYYNEKDDPLSAHLFAIGGPKWRNLRTKLTPTFTSGKMKAMFQTLVECEQFLRKKIEKKISSKTPIDIKEILGCFTTDIIGNCAFGLECNTIHEEESPFRKYGKKIFEGSKLRNLKAAFCVSFPNAARTLGLKFVPEDVSTFFRKMVKDTVEYREKNKQRRKDFLQLLIDLKNNNFANDEGYNHDGNSLTMDELAAQCFVFFLAGFETSSTTMTFALYELAKNPTVQQKLRDEINLVLEKYKGEITYEGMQELKYMDQVINETLRKYPPVTFISRESVKDYKIPDEEIILDKGVRVIVPILAIHYDKDLYPDPEKFDPERFTEENKALRHHYSHIPFGEGPRLCIGMRFGLMQTKVGLTSLLKNYKLTLNNKTQQPLKMKVTSFVLAADGDVWLDATKI